MATKHKQRQNGQKEKKKPKKTTVAENDQKVQKGPKRDSKGPRKLNITPK